MSQTIAFFDFDGTITTRDTLLEFIKFSKGKFRFYVGFAINSPWLIALKLKLISNQAAKEKILTWFFHNNTVSHFQQTCDRFAAEIIPNLIRPKALQEITTLKEKGIPVVIVSASPENWIRPWTGPNSIDLIATRLEAHEAKLTGRIQGRNCHGTEKVERINRAFRLSDYSKIYAYGDTGGDKPMLRLATNAFYKPFR
ncbi:MAG TPA: HAD-IB family hydrolase [Puia sp.]|nr:HAD-IB family hydrolase [Puia sp.]